MAEEGGGGHGEGGSSSAVGSAQRLPPPPPPQPPQPGSQAPPAPALAPDQLPQNNTLVALPIVAIENILSFMSYDEISQLRLVRPPRNPRRPLRRAEVWGGTERGRVPRGGRPPRAPAGAGARPSRPEVSLGASPRGLSPSRPSSRGWGRLPEATRPWGAPCPRPGSGAVGGKVAGVGLPTCARPERGPEGAGHRLWICHLAAPAGLGAKTPKQAKRSRPALGCLPG